MKNYKKVEKSLFLHIEAAVFNEKHCLRYEFKQSIVSPSVILTNVFLNNGIGKIINFGTRTALNNIG